MKLDCNHDVGKKHNFLSPDCGEEFNPHLLQPPPPFPSNLEINQVNKPTKTLSRDTAGHLLSKKSILGPGGTCPPPCCLFVGWFLVLLFYFLLLLLFYYLGL